jgi:hypothetical protein
LRALVAGDSRLQSELAAHADAAAFLDASAAIARRHGIAATPGDFASLAAPDPLGLLRLEEPPIRRTDWPAAGWRPYQLSMETDGALAVDWADFSGQALDGGFFADPVLRALARPYNRLLRCRTGLDDFLRGAGSEAAKPAGFVFHMSRCRSTLTARMLGALPDTEAISEPEPLNAMIHLAWQAQAPDAWRVAALKAMVGALCRAGTKRHFVKLNAWHIMALPLFRRAYPDVPWLFLYRDPAEILASQMVARGTDFTPEIVPSGLFGIPDGAQLPFETYCAAALARLGEAALAGEGGLFVDSADLPGAFTTVILPHFGVDLPAGAPFAAAAARDAKRPDSPYRPRAAPVAPAIRATADAECGAVHARLKTVHGPQSLL